jgi:predicted metal-dependent peptidase
MQDDAIETKLAAARTRLILDKPFLGALVLRLPMVEADPRWCRTTATDARTFYYNRQYIEALSLAQTQFVLAHEALHCGLLHFVRREHRVKHRWDVACDHAVNPLLVADGLRPPPGTLLVDGFEGMTAEEIYPFIKDDTEEETLDQHLYDGEGGGDGGGQGERQPEGGTGRGLEPERQAAGAPQPEPLTPTEREALSVQWQQRLAGAAQQAMQAGKLGGAMARMVDHLLQPQLPWRMLLARYLSAVGRDDYNFTRPSSRREGPAILPSLRSGQVDVVVVLDTSGSIGREEMEEFLTEVNALKGQVRARVTLHACDAVLAPDGPWTYEAWEPLELPGALKGGGGTSFVPAFQWIDGWDIPPELVVYFTDAQGEFPRQQPRYPVLWLVKGRAKVPWGQRIQLN